MSIQYAEKPCKSVLGDIGFLNTRSWTKHCFDPYENCEFDCVYCDTASKQYSGSQRNSVPVYAKTNAPEILTNEIKRLRMKGVVNIGLAMDPYQQAEKQYRLTQKILKILKENNCSFAIGTKSDLVLRDLDLISEAAKTTKSSVSITITTLDEDLAKLLEPNAPPPRKRLEAVKRLSKAGVATGVWISPIIPYITDSEENLRSIVEAAVENGAMSFLGGSLDMRNIVGFHLFLEQHFPSLVRKYDKLYKTEENIYTHYPAETYLYRLYKTFISICKQNKVKNYLPHFHTRKQALLFYLRNYLKLNGKHFSDFLPLLNYLFPTQDLMQSIQLRFGNWSFSKSFLEAFHYFPH
jgi:DNA repair photolyase